ncbi:MAG: S41 family peptidase [Polyangiaceae bacterium]
MLRFRQARPSSAPAVVLAGGALAAVWSCAVSARAASFTPEGALLFEPNAVVVLDFEEPAPEGEPQPAEDPTALHGAHILPLGAFQGVDFEVSLPKLRQTYRASAWIRGHEAVVSLEVSYSDRPDEVSALFPTGRVTSDGWVEVANTHLRVDGEKATKVVLGAFSAAGADVDAVEIVPDGDASAFPAIPNAPCGGASDSAACAADQVCLYSRCRTFSGLVPPIPKDRDDVTDYLESRMTLLFGPFRERTYDLPNSLVAIEQMRHAQDAWSYWNGFALAVRKLHDGHTSTSNIADFSLRNPRPIGVCFIEGDADLTHTAAPKDPAYLDVLVSHTGAESTLGLAPGDRLVSVDGKHPIAWARGLVDIHWSLPPVSNPRTFAELASSMNRLLSRYASKIEVIRCDAASGTCGAPEVISISDLPPIALDATVQIPTCDNRPLRHLINSPDDHGNTAVNGVHQSIVIESDDVEKIYGIEWESLYTTNGTDGVGAGLKQAVSTWKTEGARGVILDHRSGFGGTIEAPKILWSYAVPRRPNDYYEDRQRAEDEQPSAEDGQALFDLAKSRNQINYAGSNNPVTTVPVALLLTEDVSASDWLPLGMKGAPKVRLFAPFETNGAFSTRYAFGYWLGVNYVLAVGDTFLPDGTTTNGTGVSPDVVVLPKQSDLLAGKDTVYEAALAWVRSELAP